MTQVGFLGTGKIAAALVHGLAGQGHQIRVSERNPQVAADLADQLAEVEIAENAEVVAASDVVVACLMAATARTVLPELPWRPGQTVLSVMVDMPRDELLRLCAPATDIALFIPLATVATGGCPLPVWPANAALAGLYGGHNPVLPVASETALAAHFAATATSAPLLAQFAAVAGWLARETGDAEAADTYVAALFAAYLSPRLGGPDRFAALGRTLETPGGLNATLKAHMAGTPERLSEAMDNLRGRLGLPEGRP